jgi:hypothetical protein
MRSRQSGSSIPSSGCSSCDRPRRRPGRNDSRRGVVQSSQKTKNMTRLLRGNPPLPANPRALRMLGESAQEGSLYRPRQILHTRTARPGRRMSANRRPQVLPSSQPREVETPHPLSQRQNSSADRALDEIREMARCSSLSTFGSKTILQRRSRSDRPAPCSTEGGKPKGGEGEQVETGSMLLQQGAATMMSAPQASQSPVSIQRC